MRAFRIVLQFIFGLLSVLFTIAVLSAPNADYVTGLSLPAIFILIVFVLGPGWPSQENIDRWALKWKLQLPTDNQDVAKFVLNFLAAAYGFYRAWNAYAYPTQELHRIEKSAFAIAGINGVIAFWLFMAFTCLVYGMAIYGKGKRT